MLKNIQVIDPAFLIVVCPDGETFDESLGVCVVTPRLGGLQQGSQ